MVEFGRRNATFNTKASASRTRSSPRPAVREELWKFKYGDRAALALAEKLKSDATK